MPNLEHILEISIIAVIFFALGFFLEQYFNRKKKEEYKNSYKQMIENFLALNVTHLHDSANLFNLIKSNSKEQNIINFATGSAYHFRSLFNSLKKSILQIRDYDPDELNNSTLYKLIEKEEVDLKDLINIELFQLGNFSQIKVEDNITGQYAFTHGNFELLSKVFLNLVENALKYSDKQIQISLNDENDVFVVRIMSFGKSISESISLKINNKIYDDIKGHGLSSLVDIMNYHDADIHITSLPNEGSSINLEFKKAANTIKKSFEVKEEKTSSFKIMKAPFIFAATIVLLVTAYNSVKTSSQTKTSLIPIETKIAQPLIEEQKPSPKALLSSTKPNSRIKNNEFKHLDSLIDQETAKLGLDMDL